jgi:UDP-2-acetamido-3-amino-2,3-dideoxy-glucuronate N-acetyltransferase
MIHPLSSVHPDTRIGTNTMVWQFTVILQGAVIGDHCNINCQVGIEGDVVIGDHVTMKPFVCVGEGTRIGDHVFMAPNVTCINDRNPRSKQYPDEYPRTTLEDWCSIGAGSVIFPGVRVGKYALVGACSAVTKDVPDHALVFGNPARQVAWVDTKGMPMQQDGDEFVGPTGERYRIGTSGLVPIET